MKETFIKVKSINQSMMGWIIFTEDMQYLRWPLLRIDVARMFSGSQQQNEQVQFLLQSYIQHLQ